MLVYWELMAWSIIPNGGVYVKYKIVNKTKLMGLNCWPFLARACGCGYYTCLEAADGGECHLPLALSVNSSNVIKPY